jgi:hypothetical protein
MTNRFKVGDHVRWNSEAGHVTGRIIKLHTRDTEYKGHPRHASEDEPQYEIKSDKTDHIAMHKGSALHKIA